MQDYGNLANTFSDYLIYNGRKGRVLHACYLNKSNFMRCGDSALTDSGLIS